MTVDALAAFLNNDFQSHDALLDFYVANIAKDLMFCDAANILAVTQRLRDSITAYASQHSAVYAGAAGNRIYTRQDFVNSQAPWLCPNIEHVRQNAQNTSGSTTGAAFHYCSDKKHFDFLLRRSEFELIRDEYDLHNRPLVILNLFRHWYNPTPHSFAEARKNCSRRAFHTYGAEDTTTYFVNWDNYTTQPDKWHDDFLSFLAGHVFDIVLISGPVLNILSRYIKQHNFTHKFAYLLSHTSEFPRVTDFEFLRANGNIEHHCDHMRCWDGGASFFTCKYGTYHLHDNFAWVEQGPNNELISTCYFNVVSPFVRYWSGDLCAVQDTYRLCACGRHYRPFQMLQNRPFGLKGATKLTEIRKQIKELPFCSKINQVQFENLSVNIYTDAGLTDDEKMAVNAILHEYTPHYF